MADEPAILQPALPHTPTSPRGRSLSTTALTLAIGAALLLGVSTYAALAAIDVVSLDPLAGFLDWVTWIVVGLLVGVVATALALVALVYARPRRVASLALAAALVLPGLSFVAGLQQGLQVLYGNVQAEIEAGGTAVLATLESSAALHGIDISFLRTWIEG